MAIAGVRRASALFSQDRVYRYQLDREFEELSDPPESRVTFIMLNPSTADEHANDPTLARCCTFARTWGFQHLRVVNLFALRSTDPAALYAHDEPVGSDNDAMIHRAAMASDLIVCAWGAHGDHQDRGRSVVRLLGGRRLHVLKLCKGGQPMHPLYQRGDTIARPWAEAAEFAGL
jgi:hypothetical protein